MPAVIDEAFSGEGMERRRFVELVYKGGLTASFAAWLPRGSWRTRFLIEYSRETANVRTFGARGDGRTNDTLAFARAIHSLGSTGGTVLVPKGTYLIDPTQSIILIDYLTISLDPDAVVKAIPVSEGHSRLILGRNVKNVVITGGTIIGERPDHLGTAGEWGMGIELYACSDARIEGVTVKDCWGDGLYVGAERGNESRRVTIKTCVSRANRRQGLSITGCVGAHIEGCEFSDTVGTLPQSGIDLEPKGLDVVSDINITDCTMLRNAGWGFTSGKKVSNVNLTANHISFNAEGGVQVADAATVSVEKNVIESNGRHGVVVIEAATGTAIVGNTICANGWASPGKVDNVFLNRGAVNTQITDNTFACSASVDPARYDVRINSSDCVGTVVSGNGFRPKRGSTGGLDDHGRNTIATP